jgi:hypothetical protein
MNKPKAVYFFLTLLILTSAANAGNKFSIETESDWNQGSLSNLEAGSGFLNLVLTGDPNSKTDLIFVEDSNLKRYEFGSSEVNTLVENVERVGVAKDVEGDSTKEIFFVDSSGNLMYYNPSSSSKTDLGVNSVEDVGGIADLDSDGDLDLLYTQSGLYSYDFGSGTVTEHAFSGSKVGYLGDVESDGDLDVPVVVDGEKSDYDFGSNDLDYYSDSAQDAGDVFDIDTDGDVDFTWIVDGSLYRYDGTYGNTVSVSPNAANNGLGVVKDYNNQGGLDIPYVDSGNDISIYDAGLASASSVYTGTVSDVGGYFDIAYASEGSYTSKVFSYQEKQIWNNITLGDLSRPGSSSVDIEFQTSNDGFSTVNETVYINNSELSDGTGNYSLSNLDYATTDARIKINYQRGSTPSIDNVAVYSEIENQPPTISQQDLEWTGLGGSESKKLIYTLSDPDGNDIRTRNSPPSGSVAQFTNSTYEVTGFNDIFDYQARVSDTRGQTGTMASNFTLSKVHGFYTADNDYVNNESRQKVNASVQVDIRGGSSIYTISAVNPSVTNQVVTNGNTSTGSSTTGTVSTSWEWIVDHVQTQTYGTEKDSRKTSTIDTQYLVRQKEVENNGSTSFSQLEVTPVTPSLGTCSNCNTRNISISGNSKKNVSFNSSGDFLKDEKEFPFKIDADSITLGKDYVGTRRFQVKETAGFTWNGINVTQTITEPAECSQSNASTIDIAASSFSNTTVKFSCKPGNTGSPAFTAVNKSGYERYWYNTTLTVASNLTENKTLVWPIQESNLNNWQSRDAGSANAIVDEKSSDITVVDGVDTTYVKVQDDFGNSSLHKGSHSAGLTWTYGKDSDSDDGGGSTGGGGFTGGSSGDDTETDEDTTIRFTETTVRGVPGQVTPSSFVVKNFLAENNSVTVAKKAGYPACDLLEVETQTDYVTQNEMVRITHSNEFDDGGTYTLPSRSYGFTEGSFSVRIPVRVRAPTDEELRNRFQNESELVCPFAVNAGKGAAGTLELRVVSQTTFRDVLNNFYRGLPFTGENSQLLYSRDLCFSAQARSPELCPDGKVVEDVPVPAQNASAVAVLIILGMILIGSGRFSYSVLWKKYVLGQR